MAKPENNRRPDFDAMFHGLPIKREALKMVTVRMPQTMIDALETIRHKHHGDKTTSDLYRAGAAFVLRSHDNCVTCNPKRRKK